MKSFSDLLELHGQLDELFLEHQRALMRGELDRAESILMGYEAELLAHIRDEEELMLPIYRERVNAPVGGGSDIFLGEHEKLRQLLRLFKAEIEKIRKMGDVERGILFLIDSQHLFKRLLAHHDTREKQMLYPLLDQATTQAERKSLFATLKLKLKIEAQLAAAR